MSHLQTESAVLFWTNESDPALADPNSVGRLSNSNLHQRVVRITARRDGWADIQFGSQQFRVREECLRLVEPLHFHVGDDIEFSGGKGTIRDIIWHFKDTEPNYYVEQGGKKLSRRYVASDLRPMSLL